MAKKLKSLNSTIDINWQQIKIKHGLRSVPPERAARHTMEATPTPSLNYIDFALECRTLFRSKAMPTRFILLVADTTM